MVRFRVLLTDYAWTDLEIEQRVLAEVGAELVVAEQQDVATLTRLAADVDAILTCWAKTPAAVIAAAPRCQIVARLGIGLDNIDVDYCTAHGIPVTNVPDYCMVEVAEHTLGLVLALARNIAFFHHETQSGRFDLQAARTPRRLVGQTIGIVGFGKIGAEVARKAQALGMQVLATSRRRRDPPAGVSFVEFEELLGSSDFVSLHLPLNDETRGLMGHREFGLMKPSAFLVNTARGALVDHPSLATALDQRQLAGAGLDVQDPEPPDLTRPPYNDPRVIVTPHAAFTSVEALTELRERAARQVAARLDGQTPAHVVNPSVLDQKIHPG